MFCEKCGKNIADDSIFCEFCGHKNKEEKSTPHKKEEKKKVGGLTSIENETLKQMASHLEFFGYEIEKLNSESKMEIVAARHTKENNIVLWQIYPSFILFRTGLKTSKSPSSEIDDFINKINKILEITKVYYEMIDNELTIQFEAIFNGKYDKEIFGQFIDFFKNDQVKMCSVEEFNKLFID
jgi:uncharacterized membrane protein YvbJ